MKAAIQALIMCSALAAGAASAGAIEREVPLYPGKAPGSENATQKESTDFALGEWKVRNVTRPVLVPVLPDPAKALGTAVIVAPGGGFEFLSIESEGFEVAHWLADHGVTAFVLKYRLNPTPADLKVWTEEMAKRWREMMNRPTGEVRDISSTTGAQQAAADGLAAVRLLREQAARWAIRPNRIGIVGFSAGGFVAMSTATGYDVASRPDFVASIYGGMPAGAGVPADAPPLFLAVAADDPLLAGASAPIFAAWRANKREAELHVFQHGGHGFGMNLGRASSDHWIDEFWWWLQAGGHVKPAR